MKTAKIIISVIYFFSISINAQIETDCNKAKNDKHLYFGVDLNDHSLNQIIHIENHNLARFAIKIIIKKGNKRFLSKKYNLKNLFFSIEPLYKEDTINYYISKVVLKQFNPKKNEEYKIKIHVKKIRKSKDKGKKVNYDTITYNDNELKGKDVSSNIYFYRSGIIDIDLCLDYEGKSITTEVLSEYRKKSLGSHICKSRVTFN